MCRTTALFPVTGLAISQIKPWRTCCAKPITHAENAACSSLHTSTSGIHLSLMTIIFSFWKPENVFGINKRSCDKWLGIIELLKIIASPLSRCHLRGAFVFNNSAAQSQLFLSGCFTKYTLRQFLAMDFGSLSLSRLCCGWHVKVPH